MFMSGVAAPHASKHEHGGSDPVGLVCAHAVVVRSSANAPTTYEEIDVSAHVGAGTHMVALRFLAGAWTYIGVRTKGDTIDHCYTSGHGGGFQRGYFGVAQPIILCVLTDASGIVEWKCQIAVATATCELLWSMAVV